MFVSLFFVILTKIVLALASGVPTVRDGSLTAVMITGKATHATAVVLP